MHITVCRFNYFFKLALTTQGMLFLDCIMITRYIFIFWLKNPGAFKDEFWSLYVNIWVVFFSWISQIIFDVMLGTDTYHIHICTGVTPPPVNESSNLKKNLSFNNVLRLFTLLIHIIVLVRIQIYKFKESNQNAPGNKSTFTKLVNIERHSLADLTANLITVCCIIIAGVAQLQINFVEIEDFNRYPHYLYEYYYRLIRPPLTAHMVVTMYYVRHHVMRQTLVREFNEWIACNFAKILPLQKM